MAFMYYMRYDGVEITNSARVAAYAKELNLGFFQCDDGCSTLADALTTMGWKTHPEYEAPLIDGAPWIDAAEPFGSGFAGMYMLDGVYPMNSSTWEAQTNEALGDGGFVSTGRHKTREMTFRGLLLGTDLHALQHGLNWLSTVLHKGNPCEADPWRAEHLIYRDYLRYWVRYKDEASIPADDDMYQGPLVTGHPHTYKGVRDSLLEVRNPIVATSIDAFAECEGSRLEFFTRCPTSDLAKRYYRYFLDVHCTAGPTVLSSHEMPSGECETGAGAWAEVEFTLVAANPFAFRAPINLAKDPTMFAYKDYLPAGTEKPWWVMYKNAPPWGDDNLYEAPLVYRDITHTYEGLTEVMWRRMSEVDTISKKGKELVPSRQIHEVWEDPDCPVIPAFPGVPVTPLLCHPPYEGPWTQFRFRTGTNQLPKFTEMAVVMEFGARGGDLKDIRVRLTPYLEDPNETYDMQMYLHYIPDGAVLRVDGRRRSIIMYTGYVFEPDVGPGFKYGPASHLVTMDATSATFRYPTLLCGGSYWMVIDVPVGTLGGLTYSIAAVGRE